MFQLKITRILILLVFGISPASVSPKTNSSTPSVPCSKHELPCDSGQCISKYSICDGVIDCDDQSDETTKMCSDWKCPVNMYQCKYGGCVSGSAKCNGITECPDGSDENECRKNNKSKKQKCGRGFMCDSGQCIHQTKVCDGKADCDDNSDETYRVCHDFDCEFLFQCDYGACVSMDAKCNGVYDCFDGSDELLPECSVIRSQQKCILPEKPANGYYRVNNVSYIKPGKKVGVQTTLVFYCDAGYVHAGDETVMCVSENNWLIREQPRCLKTCPSTFDFSLQVECSLYNRKVNCYERIVENTTVSAKCKDHYFYKISKQRYLEDYSESRCINGSWNPPVHLISCQAECGHRHAETDIEPLIIGGQNVTDNRKYPWHIALFRKWKVYIGGRVIAEKWSNECGGSIIRSNIVLTAAHCFVHSQNPSDYAVGAAKTHKKWNARNDPNAQYRYAKEIKIIDTYEGDARSYAHDIAIIILNNHFHFNKFVLPICVDWARKVSLTDGTTGTTVGWGLTATGNQSETLKEVQLPYIKYEDCRRNLKGDIRLYHTDDKICVGRLDGQAVCKGDSGGAYAVQNPDDNLYYIVGIVSLSSQKKNEKYPTCDTQIYTLFTNVSYHTEWLRKKLFNFSF